MTDGAAAVLGPPELLADAQAYLPLVIVAATIVLLAWSPASRRRRPAHDQPGPRPPPASPEPRLTGRR